MRVLSHVDPGVRNARPRTIPVLASVVALG
jgi:hypothetical protein